MEEIDPKLIQTLRPEFSKENIEELKAYFQFTEKYQEEMSEMFMEEFKAHPVFGSLLQMQSKEERLKRETITRKLQYDAIYHNEWDAYTKDLILQGIAYAQMGLTFSNWYEVIKVTKDYYKIFVLREYADSVIKAVSVLKGVNKLTDYTMHVITESYFIEKNKVISDQQKRQNELINELKAFNSELKKRYRQLEKMKDACKVL